MSEPQNPAPSDSDSTRTPPQPDETGVTEARVANRAESLPANETVRWQREYGVSREQAEMFGLYL